MFAMKMHGKDNCLEIPNHGPDIDIAVKKMLKYIYKQIKSSN
jgi:hypothetical protein